MLRRPLVVIALAAVVVGHATRAGAHNPEQPETAPPLGTGETFLDHTTFAPFWFSAEMNTIFQTHPEFSAPYTGTNSLRPNAEAAVSGLFTVFLAYQPHRTTEIILDAEMAFGGGLSSALGVAGFTNLDVVRNPSLSSEPYVARFEIHQMIPLTRDWEENEDRGPITTFKMVPRHRIELRLGKMSTVDLFDINPAASDSHLQFMNWTVDNNGAYDYAADTRGYTYGLVVEYQGPFIEVRFGEMLMPKVANGIDIDFDVTRSHSEQLEVELKYSRRRRWAGTLRVLGYENFANMGSYQAAIDAYLANPAGGNPDIVATRRAGTTKFGFGLNAIQQLGGVARAFARGGWNDGRHESFAYTEVDDTFEIGADLAGDWWHRPVDKIGLAFVTNGISAAHREYLRLGGHGFLLGDACEFLQPTCVTRPAGYLRYGRENIVELYYNVHVWRGAFGAADVQLVDNPGYNQDRGPAWIFSLRGHLEF
jgi:high affinity Mn2+ porin